MVLDSNQLHGNLYPAVPVPFDQGGVMVETAQRDYAAWMSRQPIGGVAVWVHTGRGLFLSPEQREAVFHCWREHLKSDQAVIAGAGALPGDGKSDEAYIDEAAVMAKHAVDLGADALLCFAPIQFRDTPNQNEKIVAYHRRLAELGCPLILFYLYEAAGGVSYSQDVLEQLFELPNVIGIKMATLDSVTTYQDVSRWLTERFPNKTLITGEDRFLGYSILRGATSALVGMGAACTAMQCDLLRAGLAGAADEFCRLTKLVDVLAEHTFIQPMEGYIQRMLWILAHAGILDRCATHDPWGPELPDDEFRCLGQALARNNFL